MRIFLLWTNIFYSIDRLCTLTYRNNRSLTDYHTDWLRLPSWTRCSYLYESTELFLRDEIMSLALIILNREISLMLRADLADDVRGTFVLGMIRESSPSRFLSLSTLLFYADMRRLPMWFTYFLSLRSLSILNYDPSS